MYQVLRTNEVIRHSIKGNVQMDPVCTNMVMNGELYFDHLYISRIMYINAMQWKLRSNLLCVVYTDITFLFETCVQSAVFTP